MSQVVSRRLQAAYDMREVCMTKPAHLSVPEMLAQLEGTTAAGFPQAPPTLVVYEES
jgi:hypothetical protein